MDLTNLDKVETNQIGSTMLPFILMLAIVCAYWRWTQIRQYWAKRNVAHFPPYPILGNMTFLQKMNPALWMRKMYNSFDEPYMGVWMFWRPLLMVNSPEIAKNILMKDSVFFRNRFANSGSSDPIAKLNLFTLKDPQWSILRRRLTALYTGSKLKGMQSLMTRKSIELVQRIEQDRHKSKINMRMLITDYTTDVVGTASFGIISDATLTGESALRSITREFMKYSVYRGICWCSAFYLPELVDVFRFKLFPKPMTDFLRTIFRTVVLQRGGYEKKIKDPRDLLDVLVKLKQEENPEELTITEDLMMAQATVFLQGGFDSTATTITFCIYELAYYPEAQEKLYQELREAKKIHEDDLLDAQILSQLTYLNCVIDESLRKYPIMGWLDRIAVADYKVDDNLTIPAGTPVYVNAVGMHYDPHFYPEPDKFEPDRFLPGNIIKPFTYLPFGEGPRKCIGQRFGLSNIRHALAAIMLNFEAKPIPGSPPPSQVELEKKGMFLIPGEILYVEFVPRE